MGHAEITETPGQGGGNHQRGVAAGLFCKNAGAGGEAQIAGNGLCVCNYRVPSAGSTDAEEEDDDEGKGHHNALNETGDGGSHETAEGAVGHNHDGGDNHGGHIIKAEETVEELTAGGKTGCHVRDKENDDHQSAQRFNELSVIPEACGEKIRHGDSMNPGRITAETLRHD